MRTTTECIDGLNYNVWSCDKCNDNKQRFYTINDYYEHVRVKHSTEFVPQPGTVNGSAVYSSLGARK